MFLYKHTTDSNINVRFEVSLINLNGNNNLIRKVPGHIFEAADDSNWGWAQFIKRNEIKSLGFVKNDWILVKAYVSILED